MASSNTAILDSGRTIADSICYAPAAEPAADSDRADDVSRARAAWHAEAVAARTVSPVAFFSRFVVLQGIGAAIVAALWVAGLASRPFEGENAPICWLILAMGALGVLFVALQRWRDVQWLATHVVRIGLLGTVVGLIIAFSSARQGGSGDVEEVKTMISAVVDGMYVSLYATLLGIGTNLWLKINLRLLGNYYG